MKIILAAKKGDLQGVKSMIDTVLGQKKGKKILQRTFSLAVKHGHATIVHYLLDNFDTIKVDINVIKYAVISGNLNLVKLFCSPEDITVTVIKAAISEGSTSVLKYLVQNVDPKKVRYPISLLCTTIYHGRFEAVKYMIKTFTFEDIGYVLGILLRESIVFERDAITYYIAQLIVKHNVCLNVKLSKFVCKYVVLKTVDCLIRQFTTGISHKHVIKSAKNKHGEVFHRLLETVDIFATELSVTDQYDILENAVIGSYQNFVHIFDRIVFDEKWLSSIINTAVNCQNIKVLQFLGSQFAIKQKTLDQALFDAAFYVNADLLRCLVSLGANIFANNCRALHTATRYDRISNIEYLLQVGSHYDHIDTNFLDSKMNHRDQKIALYILEDRPELRDGAMNIAVSCGLVEVIEYLLSVGIPMSGVNPDTKYSKKMTQLLVCNGHWFQRLDPYRYIRILDDRHLDAISDPMIRKIILGKERKYHWPTDLMVTIQN